VIVDARHERAVAERLAVLEAEQLVDCPRCNGRGTLPGARRRICPTCGGAKRLRRSMEGK
jgi:DnaJ-class molecular chaperone